MLDGAAKSDDDWVVNTLDKTGLKHSIIANRHSKMVETV